MSARLVRTQAGFKSRFDYQLELLTYLGRISFKNTRTLSLE